MADIIITTDKPSLPVTSKGTTEYGELNYIFYPGISEYKKTYLTNTTGANKNVVVKFKPSTTEPDWYRTLRVSETNSGVQPSGVFDNQWSGTVNAGSTKTLYVYSECTKEGYSGQYPGTYWTNSGLGIADLDFVNDKNNIDAAIDCDAADAASTLKLDLGAGVAEEFVRVKFDVTGKVEAVFNIQYSDDDTTWTTVYTGADLAICLDVKQMTVWWDKAGAHRYWRIYKTNAATGGADIAGVQWLLFEAHKDAYDFGVYGDKKAFMYDVNGNFDDYELRTSVMIVTDIFSRQAFRKPRGRIGPKTLKAVENIEKYGSTIQMWYVPTMTMKGALNIYSDFQLEKRIWNTKAIITPAKRDLRYVVGGVGATTYAYDQRRILFSPYGPDYVGWYMPNYDFWHTYGHSYYVLWDRRCYKVDDPQPIYLDDEIVGISARFHLQTDMVALTTPHDPRNYIMENSRGLPTEFPDQTVYPGWTGYNFDPETPEQTAVRWSGTTLGAMVSRGWSRHPTTYSLTHYVDPVGGGLLGTSYVTDEWLNPATAAFTTAVPVIFGKKIKDDTTYAEFFQMSKYYNWIGMYLHTGSPFDTMNALVQVYYDEDCTIPIRINQTYDTWNTYTEGKFHHDYISATGEVTLTALGNIAVVDGHSVRTPTKLYVKYRRESGETAYYLV